MRGHYSTKYPREDMRGNIIVSTYQAPEICCVNNHFAHKCIKVTISI